MGRRCAAPSELFHFQTPAARRSRSEEPGLFDEQKLLYILLHPKHWVSAAGNAVGQSYGREGDGLTYSVVPVYPRPGWRVGRRRTDVYANARRHYVK